jgi:hypothetical protein
MCCRPRLSHIILVQYLLDSFINELIVLENRWQTDALSTNHRFPALKYIIRGGLNDAAGVLALNVLLEFCSDEASLCMPALLGAPLDDSHDGLFFLVMPPVDPVVEIFLESMSQDLVHII